MPTVPPSLVRFSLHRSQRQAVGSIIVFRDIPGRFKEEQVALLKTFSYNFV